MRLLTRRSLLYSEMIAAAAIVHGDRGRLLDFDAEEKPLSLQIGTGNPSEAAQAVRIAEDWDYDEINLNVGCPSDRVQSGEFGACLMAEPQRVADILSAMRQATKKPVTVKHRIGIESRTKSISLHAYEDMVKFVETVSRTGIEKFIVHARIAILEGLSPKENRNIPPLRYEEVYRLKQDFPDLTIEINGGIKTIDQIRAQLGRVDSVMLGRVSYEDPYELARIDREFYDPNSPVPSRREVAEGSFRLLRTWADQGQNPRNLIWPILELFSGLPGTRRWKRSLSPPFPPGAELADILEQALEAAPADYLDRPPVEAGPNRR